MYHIFADFYLNCPKAPYTHIIKISLKIIKVVVCESFCEGFPNSATHTSFRYFLFCT